MTDPTPTGDPAPEREPDATAGGSHRAPLAEGEEPEPSRLERAKGAYDLVSDILTPQTLFILLAAAIIGVTGLLGGWNNVATVEKELPELHVGEQVKADPFEITVTSARVVDEYKPLLVKDYGGEHRFVMVALALTNTSDRAVDVGELREALILESPDLAADNRLGPIIHRTLDGQPEVVFQPRLPTRYVAVYQQKLTDPAPTELTFRIEKQTYRQSSISGESNWTDGEPTFHLTVPVEAS